MDDKFVKKYLRMAKFLAEDQNPCYARRVGAVIVKADINKVVGTGYNGPPRGVPHCDSKDHLKNVVWPQLQQWERDLIDLKPVTCEEFSDKYADCKICPRRLIKAPSGARLELCSCAHAEANAICNAAQDLHNCFIFCWCPLPCIECTKLIINAGIKKVYCYQEEKDYSVGSRFLLSKAKVEVIEVPKTFIDSD